MTQTLLTPKDVARILNVHVDTARNEMRTKMRHVEIGGPKRTMIRVSEEALERYLRDSVQVPTRERRQKRESAPKPSRAIAYR